MDSFAKRLEKLIGGQKQSAFAKFVGLGQSTISGYLHGMEPNGSALRSIAKACNVSADWLLGLVDNRHREESAQNASRYTGLSDVAIEELHKVQAAGYGYLVDKIIASEKFAELIVAINEAVNLADPPETKAIDELLSKQTNKVYLNPAYYGAVFVSTRMLSEIIEGIAPPPKTMAEIYMETIDNALDQDGSGGA